MPLGVVSGVGQGMHVLDGGPGPLRGRGGFGGCWCWLLVLDLPLHC